MEIKLNTNVDSVARLEGSQPKKAVSEPVEEAAPAFAQSQALDQALRQTPEVRAETVSGARQLVNQKSYPPTETIKKIASLLAQHIDQED